MYRLQQLLGTLAILLLLSGCSSFQAKEARRSIAVGLFEAVVDNATDGIPYEKSAHSQYLRDIAEREEDARRRQERENRHYAEEARSMFDAFDQAERLPGQGQLVSTPAAYKRRQEEQLSRRSETLENQAEFDSFMHELQAAAELNNNPWSSMWLMIGSSRQSSGLIDNESTEKCAVNAPLADNQQKAGFKEDCGPKPGQLYRGR